MCLQIQDCLYSTFSAPICADNDKTHAISHMILLTMPLSYAMDCLKVYDEGNLGFLAISTFFFPCFFLKISLSFVLISNEYDVSVIIFE